MTEKSPVLTDEQRSLVEKNVGLVAVHLRRHVPNLQTLRRDREWDDLFQEGCLGLMEAARQYEPERGIPFAAFALLRIQNATSRALRTAFATVGVPQRPAESRRRPARKPAGKPGGGGDRDGGTDARRGSAASGSGRAGTGHTGTGPDEADGAGHRGGGGRSGAGGTRSSSRIPRVASLSEGAARSLAARMEKEAASGETIGDRLRAKYERAVKLAAARLARGQTRRGDRAELIALLARERFLIPQEDSRRSLRQIARDTHSSYARVAQFDKQLAGVARTFLESDPEFVALRQRGREAPAGLETVIDDAFEAELSQIAGEELARAWREATRSHRGDVLLSLLRLCGDDVETMISRRLMLLPAATREHLLRLAKAA